MRKRFSVLAVACSALSVAYSAVPGLAQGAPTVGGACVPPSSSVSAEKAAQFLDNPSALLSAFPEGSGTLSAAVRDLVTIRPESVEGMPGLAGVASPDQLRAIGAGLGTAAAVCVLAQPATAQRIQEAVLRTDKPELVDAFTSIVGDVPTSAIPDLPLTGETTAGGGRGFALTPTPGGGMTSTSDGSLFQAVAVASRGSTVAANLSVSPAQ